MASPRVFVSSTYYDLKHLRSALDAFIAGLGYEGVLSEKGDIAYAPDAPLDDSCYRAAEQADIFVLIIGGRYGSSLEINDVAESASMRNTRISDKPSEETSVKNSIKSFFCSSEKILVSSRRFDSSSIRDCDVSGDTEEITSSRYRRRVLFDSPSCATSDARDVSWSFSESRLSKSLNRPAH